MKLRLKMPQKKNAVASLRRESAPHPSRTVGIRRWHFDQIESDPPAVAMLHISVTADGQIVTKGMGLDHVHATIVLETLDDLRQRLLGYIGRPGSASITKLHL